MAYVYRHIRLDKNVPFYIGIGSDEKYKRAKCKIRNNVLWRNVINITDYKIEILLDDLTWDEACVKEIEFISLYGRKNLGKGTLVNLTDGGDGQLGFVFSKDSKDKMSESHKGQVAWNKGKTGVFSEATLIKMSESHKNISDETRNKMVIASINISDEKRKNMSEAQKGNKNASKPRSDEVKRKQSERMKGQKRIISDEKLKEQSERMKGNKYAQKNKKTKNNEKDNK